jgi:protein TonB
MSILHDRVVHQPTRVPPRIDANTDEEPPDLFDLSVPIAHDGLGPGIGEATQNSSVARPEAKPRPSGPVMMSTGVMTARLIHRVQPSYPAAASLIQLEGTVELRAIIATDGSVRNLEVVRGNPILAAAAVEAVREWRYQPTRLSGIPVEVETIITVQFQMR